MEIPHLLRGLRLVYALYAELIKQTTHAPFPDAAIHISYAA